MSNQIYYVQLVTYKGGNLPYFLHFPFFRFTVMSIMYDLPYKDAITIDLHKLS